MRRPSHDACAALAAALDVCIRKADDEQREALIKILRKAGYTLPEATAEAYERLTSGVSGALSAESRSIIRRVKDAVDLKSLARHLIGDVKLDDTLVNGLYTLFSESFKTFMPKLIKSYSAQIDNQLAIGSMTKRTTDFVQSWSGELARLMKLDTANHLERMLQETLQKGESVDKLSRRIMDSDIRNPEWRARRVALTEMLRAHSYAQLDAYTQNPAVTQKRWMHTAAKFSKPRENHVAMDGQVADVNGTFSLMGADGGEYHPKCPRDTGLPPGESINCHCIIQPVIDENILGMSLEERDKLWAEAVEKDNREWEAELNERRWREALAYRGEKDTNVPVWVKPGSKTKDTADAKAATRFKTSKLTSDQQKSLAERFAKGSERARKVYDKYVPEGTAIRGTAKPDEARFVALTNDVYMNVASDAHNTHGNWTTYFHEHGHYVDYNAGDAALKYRRYVSENDQAFIDALKADVKNREKTAKQTKGLKHIGAARFDISGELQEKAGDRSGGVLDIYGGVVGNYYPGAWFGHSPSYWKQDRNRTLAHEAFANMFEALFDPEKIQLMEEYLPTSWKRFNEILEDLENA